MYSVRRIPNEIPAIYRPTFRLVEPRPRAVVSARRTFLWIGLVLACLLLLGSVDIFILQRVSLTPLPESVSNPPIYPGAQNVRVTTSNDCRKDITFTSNDSDAKIAAFYESVFAKDGWSSPSTLTGDTKLYTEFNYVQRSLDGHVLNSFQIDVSFTDASETQMNLSITDQLVMCWPFAIY
jgi:hypothetical protein